ncbi:MAG: gamma-glutamylcyclotransferase [Planctomycetaceae bacterium]|nr:gamma-glutamylcyclotransferase [Planctomycetaceae bacterium]
MVECSGRHFVFVYGTLMRGGCRAHALGDEHFLGTARTAPCYRLFDCGEYPGLVPNGNRSIVGELWEVSARCLEQLDQIEGVDEGLYERRPIQLQPPGTEHPVEAYFYLMPTTGLVDCGDRWVNGPHSSRGSG